MNGDIVKKIVMRLTGLSIESVVRDISLLSSSVFVETHRVSFSAIFGQKGPFIGLFLRRTDGMVVYYKSADEYGAFSEELGKRYLDDPSYAREISDRLISMSDDIREFIGSHPRADDLRSDWAGFAKLYRDFFAYHQAVYWPSEYILNGVDADSGIDKMHVDSVVRMLDDAYKYNETVVPEVESFFSGFGIGNCLQDEVISRLSDTTVSRADGRSIVVVDGAVYVIGPQEAEKINSELRNMIAKSASFDGEIRGVAASGGIIRGRARLVTDLGQLAECEDGEVLVTTQTRPQYNACIRKVSAIVTDEGGMLCHASMLAREFGIPCIVGTKIATQILHDGDLVEVDADQGVVRKVSEDVITLSKIYSREKSLFYFTMWNDSNLKGYLDFLDHHVRNHLFIVRPEGEKGSVWYDRNELAEIDRKIIERLQDDDSFVSRLRERLDAEWTELRPYLADGKRVGSAEEFRRYYNVLVSWWSVMNTAFGIPDMVEVDEAVRKLFLDYREQSQDYTERMSGVFVDFWNERFPTHTDIGFFVTPEEAIALVESGLSEEMVEVMNRRKNGVILLNEQLYPIASLDEELVVRGLALEMTRIENAETLQGVVACKGSAAIVGRVRIIAGLKDMRRFGKNEILVTEMTNPEYVPIMRLASAIVTDEGGLTCHAAIASREIGVPCVIGTKIATQVLHDGDLVEVDADHGVVRVVEHKGIDGAVDLSDFDRIRDRGPWENVGTRKMTIHRAFDFAECVCIRSREMFRTGLDENIVICEHGEIYQYFREQANIRFIEGFGLYFESRYDNGYAREHMVPDSEQFMSWLSQYCEESRLSRCDNDALADLLVKRHDMHQLLLAWQWLAFSGKYAIEQAIVKRLEAAGWSRHLMMTVLSLDEPVYMLEEDIAVRKLALGVKDGSISSEMLDHRIGSHRVRYGYFVMYDETYPEMTTEDIAGRIQTYVNDERLEEGIREDLERYERNRISFDDFIQDERMSDESRDFFRFAHEYARYMELKNLYKALSAKRSIPLFREIAKRSGTDMRSLLCFRDEEILEFLDGSRPFDAHEAESRYLYSALAYTSGDIGVITDPAAVDSIKRSVSPVKQMGLITGNTAYPGLVRGTVRIVNSIDGLSKLGDGDVLVSSMTRPDFLVAMKKAVAIVTDEGSIICHAAIVARELKKPCVIGTKIATQVLRDGDLVEVDADKGTVRIAH